MDIVVTITLLAVVVCDLVVLLDIFKCLPDESSCLY
jgi:hypothetical protein